MRARVCVCIEFVGGVDGRLRYVRVCPLPWPYLPPSQTDPNPTHLDIGVRLAHVVVVQADAKNKQTNNQKPLTWISAWGSRMSSFRQMNLVFFARMLFSCARVLSTSSPSISKVTCTYVTALGGKAFVGWLIGWLVGWLVWWWWWWWWWDQCCCWRWVFLKSMGKMGWCTSVHVHTHAHIHIHPCRRPPPTAHILTYIYAHTPLPPPCHPRTHILHRPRRPGLGAARVPVQVLHNPGAPRQPRKGDTRLPLHRDGLPPALRRRRRRLPLLLLLLFSRSSSRRGEGGGGGVVEHAGLDLHQVLVGRVSPHPQGRQRDELVVG